MRIAVTHADQELARLDVKLAERLGEEVDPKIKQIADADLSVADEDELPSDVVPGSVFIDDETGGPFAVLRSLRGLTPSFSHLFDTPRPGITPLTLAFLPTKWPVSTHELERGSFTAEPARTAQPHSEQSDLDH